MAVRGAKKANALPALRAGTITGLVVRGEQGQQVAVHIDDGFAFCLAADVAGEAGLRMGQYLSVEDLASLWQANQPHAARQYALGVLSRRDSSGHEVGLKLRQQAFSDEVVEATLAWLEEHRFVDDRRYSIAYAEQRLSAGWGRALIVRELLKKGIARELLAGEAWDELVGPDYEDDGVEAAVALARRRFRGQLRANPERTRRRLAAFLARRGHDWETIRRVTRQIMDEIRSDAEDRSDAADRGAPP